jgi:PAS domain S-box-containing protein
MISRRRQQVEGSLLDSQELFRLAFNDAAIGMALVATNGRWLKVNRALCEIVGYSEADLLKTTFQEITHPDDLEADLGCVRRMLAGEIRTYQMEKPYFHSSGDVVWILQPDGLIDVVWQVGKLPVISADSGQMYQLFQNILGNSFKYRQPGIALAIKIYQTATRQNNQLGSSWEIVIEDNGIGFDQEYHEQIFEPCQRLHNSGDYEGRGLGLAICRRIIERHEGTISARSKPGEGAKFIITLPYREREEGYEETRRQGYKEIRR